jgi:hypothetical protein
MKPTLIPRAIIILSLVLVTMTFLAGVSHAFDTARAASAMPATAASSQVENDIQITPVPISSPALVSGDTAGIIAFAIVIVSIVLVGTTLGTNKPGKKKTP